MKTLSNIIALVVLVYIASARQQGLIPIILSGVSMIWLMATATHALASNTEQESHAQSRTEV